MILDELCDALGRIPRSHVEMNQGDALLFLDEFADGIRLHPGAIQIAHPVWSPRGEPALELYHVDKTLDEVLIVTVGDVVFSPHLATLWSGSIVLTVELPRLVAYTEMLEDCERLAVGLEEGHLSLSQGEEQIVAQLLRTRSFIVGAKQVGLAPFLAVEWWARAWATVRDYFSDLKWETPLWWDELAARTPSTENLPSRRPEITDYGAELLALRVEHFNTLQPTFVVMGVDEELVAIWKSVMTVAPRHIAAAALEGLPYATATMHLYEEGGGGFDLRHQDPLGWTGLLQLSFSMKNSTLAIDEVRIPQGKGQGLFQKFVFNAESIGRLLGVDEITINATGVGAYAFASFGSYGNRPRNLSS